MAALFNLAPEQFGEVASYLNTQECTALWLCGDVRVQWRLSKGKAMRKMVLRWRFNSKCLWPSQIIEFDGLEAFSFIQRNVGSEKRLTGHHLSTLSRDLKKLELDCDQGMEALNELYELNKSHFRDLEKLSFRRSTKNLVECHLPRTKDLSISLPQLDSSLPLSILPSNLTRLYCLAGVMEIGKSKFPPGLTSLELHFSMSSHFFFLARYFPSTSSNHVAPNSQRRFRSSNYR
jgi:hypothetical protein